MTMPCYADDDECSLRRKAIEGRLSTAKTGLPRNPSVVITRCDRWTRGGC